MKKAIVTGMITLLSALALPGCGQDAVSSKTKAHSEVKEKRAIPLSHNQFGELFYAIQMGQTMADVDGQRILLGGLNQKANTIWGFESSEQGGLGERVEYQANKAPCKGGTCQKVSLKEYVDILASQRTKGATMADTSFGRFYIAGLGDSYDGIRGFVKKGGKLSEIFVVFAAKTGKIPVK